MVIDSEGAERDGEIVDSGRRENQSGSAACEADDSGNADSGKMEAPKTSMVVPSDVEAKIAAAVGRLRHEINNQLFVASMILTSCRDRHSRAGLSVTDEDGNDGQTITDLETCLLRIAHVLRIAGKRSKIEKMKMERVNICGMLAEWSQLLNRIYGERTEIKAYVPNEKIYINADPDCIFEVLLNLVRNAIDSMNGCLERANLLQIRMERSGEDVTIAVTDNGAGFDQEILRRDGGVWQSTKGEGHGIGLNTCNDLLMRMKASFQVQNNYPPMHGAEVIMRFQRVEAAGDDQRNR